MEKLSQSVKNLIAAFEDSISQQIPIFEAEVKALIAREEKDKKEIEKYLDAMLSLKNLGFSTDLFVKLLDYYKTLDAEAAAFYWVEFDKEAE